MRKRKRYINASMLVGAVLFLGIGALTSTPASLERGASDMFAAVGVSMAVAPNPYNSVADQLSTKEKQLDKREAELGVKENAATPGTQNSQSARYGFYSLCMSAALFALVAINFYYDARRRGGVEPARKFSIDLR